MKSTLHGTVICRTRSAMKMKEPRSTLISISSFPS